MPKLWFLIVTVLVLLDSSDSSPCRYWCRTHENHYYCCPNGHPESSKFKEEWSTNFWVHIINFLMDCIIHKHKEYHTLEPDIQTPQCPPARSVCPKSWSFDPPKLCASDQACGTWEKCCYDVCLKHKVCKPAE